MEFFETLQQSVVATEDTIQSLTNASLQRNLLNRETQKLVSLKAKVFIQFYVFCSFYILFETLTLFKG